MISIVDLKVTLVVRCLTSRIFREVNRATGRMVTADKNVLSGLVKMISGLQKHNNKVYISMNMNMIMIMIGINMNMNIK